MAARVEKARKAKEAAEEAAKSKRGRVATASDEANHKIFLPSFLRDFTPRSQLKRFEPSPFPVLFLFHPLSRPLPCRSCSLSFSVSLPQAAGGRALMDKPIAPTWPKATADIVNELFNHTDSLGARAEVGSVGRICEVWSVERVVRWGASGPC